VALPFIRMAARHICRWEGKYTAALKRLAGDKSLPAEIAKEASGLANAAQRFGDKIHSLYG